MKQDRMDRRHGKSMRVIPVLFVGMILIAAVLILRSPEGMRLLDFLTVRDSQGPEQGDSVGNDSNVSEKSLWDIIFLGSFSENKDRRTSFQLGSETNNQPVHHLPSLKREDGSSSGFLGLASRIPASYDYTSPVPESTPVTKAYLSDAVLIGDSRMQGLILYCGLSGVTSYTYKGLTVDAVFTQPVIPWEEGEEVPEWERVPEELVEDGKIPVMEALRRTEYNKVYIQLGINETGWQSSDYFFKAYKGLIEAIREDNPGCLIYVLSIFPVSQKTSDSHAYVNNEKIRIYNEGLLQLAAEEKVFFVDLAPAVVNEDGVLPPDAGVDGIHLNQPYCNLVLEYLYAHTVPLEDNQTVKEQE